MAEIKLDPKEFRMYERAFHILEDMYDDIENSGVITTKVVRDMEEFFLNLDKGENV